MSKKKTYEKPELSRRSLEAALYEANRQLWESNQKLEQAERQRRELISNLSHDLRAPLAAMSGTVELLNARLPAENEDCRKLLRVMEERVGRMSKMVEDLFCLAQMDQPSFTMNPVVLDAEIFLEEYFISCEVNGICADRSLKERITGLEGCRIRIDPDKMVRVLDNLFANAVRYTRTGDTITLSAECVGQGNQRQLRIGVTDTGTGIAEEDLAHVFERSYRADKARVPNGGNCGLGLAICKGIAEHHGGRIYCRSQLGRGSSFYLELPCVNEETI